MTHHDAFLQDVLANPADDAPRLVYADWLEDNGDPERGEFIRVQCELARWESMSLCPPLPTAIALRDREHELLSANALAWFRALAWPGWHAVGGVAYPDGTGWHGGWAGDEHNGFVTANFTRGLVTHVSITCRRWLGLGPRLVRHMPLERVDLRGRSPDTRGPAHLGLFFWVTRRDWQASENGLPPGLRPHLESGVIRDLGPAPAFDVCGHYYPTEAAARDDLSRAALALAGARKAPAP